MKIAFKLAAAFATLALVGVAMPAQAENKYLGVDVSLANGKVTLNSIIASATHKYEVASGDIQKDFDVNGTETTDKSKISGHLKMHRDSQNASIVAVAQSGVSAVIAWDFAETKVKVKVFNGSKLLASDLPPHGSLSLSLQYKEVASLTVVQSYVKSFSGVKAQFVATNTVVAAGPLATLVAATTAKVRYQTFLANNQFYPLVNANCSSFGIANSSPLKVHVRGQRDSTNPFNPTDTKNLTDMTAQWTFGSLNSFVGTKTNQSVPFYVLSTNFGIYAPLENGTIGSSTQLVANQGPITNNVVVKLYQNESLGACTPYKLNLDGYATVNSNGSMSFTATYLNAPYQEVDVYMSSTGTWTPLLWSTPDSVLGLSCMLGTSVSTSCQKTQ